MHFNRIRSLWFLSFVYLFLFFSTTAYADAVDVELSRDKIAFGETFTLSFSLNSADPNISPDFSPLEKDFRVLSTNYGNAINMINGVTKTQTFWRLRLEPKTTGVHPIPEINFGNIKSALHQIVVEDARPYANDKQKESVFVEGKVSTLTPYIQSKVIYTFKLYYQTQLENPRIEIPQIKDVMFVQLGEGNHYQTTVNGKPFVVVEKNFAFYPNKPGKLEIPPFHLRAFMVDTSQNTYDDPFFFTQTRPIALATKPYTLTIQETPAQFQGSTWLPANDIAISEQWSLNPSQWELGNPVTRTIKVIAHGLRGDQLPDLSIAKIPGVNVYVDPPKRNTQIENSEVIGSLEQKVTYIPNVSEPITIPPVELKWWNLRTNSNAQAQLQSITVPIKGNIIKNEISNQPPLNQQPVIDEPAKQIDNKLTPVNPPTPQPIIKVETKRFYSSIWFWIAIVLFFMWLITYFVLRRRRPSSQIIQNTAENTSLDKKSVDDAELKRACQQGNPALAQQFLLAWAKNQTEDMPLNLEQIHNLVDDELFSVELKKLEAAMYAKQPGPWNGQYLWDAYQKMKKHRKGGLHSPKTCTQAKQDPLPPLNP